MLPADICLYFLFINISRIISGLRRKNEKSIYNATDLEAVLPMIQRCIAKKVAAIKYSIPILVFKLSPCSKCNLFLFG